MGGGTKGSQLGWHRRRARCDVSGRLALALALLWANASAPGRVAAQAPETGPDADSTLLIQSAAASFDQYDNFEQRGDRFLEFAEKYFG